MSRELNIEEQSEKCGTSAMGGAGAPTGAPCSFGPAGALPMPAGRGVWASVLGKLGFGGLAIVAFAGLGYWSMQHEGRSVLSIAEARAASDQANARGKNEWLAAGAPAKPNGASEPAASASASATGRVQPCPAVAANDAKSSPGANAGATAPKIVLNTAEVADLTKLPGVGAKRAQAILELRARLGRFRKVTDLLRVRGIGVKGLRKIEPLVVLDLPPVS